MKRFLPFGRNAFSVFKTALSVIFATFLLTGDLFAQAPAISYSTPQTYVVGTAISALSPANPGGAVSSFGYGAPTLVTTGVTDPICMVTDASGNMFIGENSGKVSVLPAGGSAAILVASGFGPVTGIALDASGNVILADGTHVWKIPTGGGTPVTLGSFHQPVAVAVGPDGNIYVCDFNNQYGDVYQLAPDGTAQGVDYNTPPSVGQAAGIGFDAAGNYFVTDYYWGIVYGKPAGSQYLSDPDIRVSHPSFLTVDPSGNVFFTDQNNLYRFTPNATYISSPGTLTTIANISTKGLMTDASLNLYYADGSNIYKMSPSGGYFINPKLPGGLTFDSRTGTISGTPTGVMAAANYTITAFNASGSNSTTLNLAVNPQLPTISYSSPHSYQVGTAISALSPASSNVTSWSYSGNATAIGSGYGLPVDVATDAAGNIYSVDYINNQVDKMPIGGGAAVVLASGFNAAFGLAVDAAGNVYVADAGNNAVKEIVAGTGAANVIGSGFNQPAAVTVDASGNVYVGDTGNGALTKIPAGNGTPVVLQSGFASIQGVALDAAGNIYVADAGVGTSGNGAVYKVPASGGSMVSVGSGFNRPAAVAVDAGGNLYVTDIDKSVVTIIEPDGTQFTAGSGLNHCNGVAFDSNGNLYVADAGTSTVKQVKITGGYFLSPLLPAGLSFNNSTGVISGTPATPIAATSYTITGSNITGSASANISITVGAPIISYNTPVTYAPGMAITPLTPSSAGGAVPNRNYAAPVAVPSGITDATCITVDKAGNLYIGQASGQVSKLTPGSSTVTVYATGFAVIDPQYIQQGIAADPSGNVYFADGTSLWKIPVGGGTPATLGSFSQASSVAVDTAGYLYVATLSGLFKIAADGSGQTTILTGGIDKVTVDTNGNLFFMAGNFIYEIPPGGTYKQIGSSAITLAMACDQSGNVYMLRSSGTAFRMFPVDGSSPYYQGPIVNLTQTAGLVIDANFNIYTACGTITKYSPNGGFYTSPELPTGLSVNSNTGVISGTPVNASPNTNYTITAFNTSASTTATVNITVGPPPVISYSTPQTFTAGTAITALLPASTGATIGAPGFSSNSVSVSPLITDATCTVIDKNGNLYFGESSNKVSVLAAGSAVPTVLATGVGTNSVSGGIAADATGNVYLADGTWLWKIPAGGGTAVKINSDNPRQVVVDANNNIYIGTFSGVFKINADGSNKTQIGNTGVGIMAIDQNHNIFFSFRGSLTGLHEVLPGGGQKAIISGVGFRAFATDPPGNIYMINIDNSIGMVPAGGSTETQVLPAVTGTTGIMIGPDLSLYTVVSGRIFKTLPTGGYFISPELPDGLTVDPTTGAISGTPTAAAPATNYTVTAFSGSVSGSANVNITVNLPVPVVSYATPQVFAQNVAISPLTPVSTYVSLPAYPGTSTTLGSFTSPSGTATDQNGNIYVADKSATGITELLAGGGQATIGTGLSTPAAVAVDKFGNVYSVNQGDNTVTEIQAHSGIQTNIGNGYQHPTAVAVDSAGNVFVADIQGPAGVVYRIKPGQSKQLFRGGFINPTGLAIDASGNVYVSDGGGPTSTVYKIAAAGGVKTHLNGSFNTAAGIAADASGNIFVSDSGGADIIEYPAGGGAPVTITAGLTAPSGLSADGAGNLYVADAGANKVVKLTPAGGYFINRPLPAGLSFNTATGAISGTPTAASAAVNYTVSAYNANNSGQAAVSIKVLSNNASLASMGPAKGPLSPVFNSNITSYTMTVSNTATSFTVAPVSVDPNATITVNGNPVASGNTSAPVSLDVNVPTTVNVMVTAADGTTTKTYTIVVTRPESGNALLSSMGPQYGPLSPVFKPGINSYSITLANDKQTFTVAPVAAEPNATIQVNGVTVTSGDTCDPVTLPEGQTTNISVLVTAQDGSTNTYTVAVTRAPSGNAGLVSMGPGYGPLSPTFKVGTTSYTLNVPYSKASMTVAPVTADANATITVNGDPLTSGATSAPVSLTPGTSTSITVVVTAQDGTTTKTYTIAVTRAASSGNADLSSIGPQYGPLSPVFYPAGTSYRLNVPNSTSTFTVTPIAADPLATITVNGTTVASGNTSDPVALIPGAVINIYVIVTAQDGTTTKTYTLAVGRAQGSSDSYQAISVTKPAETVTLAEDDIKVHQGVSPNGDGIDDVLQIDNVAQYPDNHLKIMNRNGELVYDAKGYDNTSKAFDGRSGKTGKMQLPGTYFFQLDYTVNGITKTKTGYLVLKY